MVEKSKVSVATFNTLGVPFVSPDLNQRYEAFSSELNELDIDIVNLQEVFTYGLLNVLRSNLGSFSHIVYEPGLLGPKAGLVTLSRISIDQVQYYSLLRKGNWLEDMIKIVQSKGLDKGVLITTMQSLPLTVFNVHLSPNRDNDWSPQNRFYKLYLDQIGQISALAKELSRKSKNLLVSGDFNIARPSELYQRITEETGLDDPFEDTADPTYHSEFLRAGQRANRIDYILFYSKEKNFHSESIGQLFDRKIRLPNDRISYLSDHIGLTATFSFS